jgi:metal-dependent amidase/aminoacylase/carboxypeptidase family protein
MEKHGFAVTKNYLLETAWVATYTHGQGGRVLGVNSEMDALPGIGHACGHNLIGISGVAVALAAKAAMERLNIDGKVVLLGTPGALVFANTCDGGLRDNTRSSRGRWFWQGHAV